MLPTLTMKVGEVRHAKHCRTAAWWSAEECGLKLVLIPLRPKRPRDVRSFGPLQILVCGGEANRATSGDLSQTQAHFKLQSKNFFDLAHEQSPGWQADPPFEERLPAIVLSSAVSLWKSFRRSRTPFRDRPETVSASSRNRCSPSFRNPVRDHRGMSFGIIPESRSPCPGFPTNGRTRCRTVVMPSVARSLRVLPSAE